MVDHFDVLLTPFLVISYIYSINNGIEFIEEVNVRYLLKYVKGVHHWFMKLHKWPTLMTSSSTYEMNLALAIKNE